MTRREFEENVYDWESLIEFASEIECDACDELVLGSDLSGRIGDDLHDYAYDYDWTDIRRWLMDIQDGHDCYRREGSFEYSMLDEDDFDEIKEDVANYADRYNYWDPDDEEDLDEEDDENDENTEDDDDEDFEVPEEEFSVSDLFGFCTKKLVEVAIEEEADRKAEDEAFTAFFCSC